MTTEPSSSASDSSVRDARHGPEVVLDAFLSALSRGDGATVAGLTGAKAGLGARALADAVAGSLFAPYKDESDKEGKEEEEEEESGGGESVPPWLRGSGRDDDGGEESRRRRRRFPRELEPLVALFLQGSHYDLLSVKMLSARQAWGMTGVRPAGDDGTGFILGREAPQQEQPPSSSPPPPPPSSSSSSYPPSSFERNDGDGGDGDSASPPPSQQRQQQRRREQWQDELQAQSRHPRAAFIFRLELCGADGCWEVRDVARVGGGSASGGAFSFG